MIAARLRSRLERLENSSLASREGLRRQVEQAALASLSTPDLEVLHEAGQVTTANRELTPEQLKAVEAYHRAFEAEMAKMAPVRRWDLQQYLHRLQ